MELDIKVVLRHSTLTLWADMKTNLFEYSWILMKTLEINEILRKKSKGLTSKITHISLIVALEYQT